MKKDEFLFTVRRRLLFERDSIVTFDLNERALFCIDKNDRILFENEPTPYHVQDVECIQYADSDNDNCSSNGKIIIVFCNGDRLRIKEKDSRYYCFDINGITYDGIERWELFDSQLESQTKAQYCFHSKEEIISQLQKCMAITDMGINVNHEWNEQAEIFFEDDHLYIDSDLKTPYFWSDIRRILYRRSKYCSSKHNEVIILFNNEDCIIIRSDNYSAIINGEYYDRIESMEEMYNLMVIFGVH